MTMAATTGTPTDNPRVGKAERMPGEMKLTGRSKRLMKSIHSSMASTRPPRPSPGQRLESQRRKDESSSKIENGVAGSSVGLTGSSDGTASASVVISEPDPCLDDGKDAGHHARNNRGQHEARQRFFRVLFVNRLVDGDAAAGLHVADAVGLGPGHEANLPQRCEETLDEPAFVDGEKGEHHHHPDTRRQDESQTVIDLGVRGDGPKKQSHGPAADGRQGCEQAHDLGGHFRLDEDARKVFGNKYRNYREGGEEKDHEHKPALAETGRSFVLGEVHSKLQKSVSSAWSGRNFRAVSLQSRHIAMQFRHRTLLPVFRSYEYGMAGIIRLGSGG